MNVTGVAWSFPCKSGPQFGTGTGIGCVSGMPPESAGATQERPYFRTEDGLMDSGLRARPTGPRFPGSAGILVSVGPLDQPERILGKLPSPLLGLLVPPGLERDGSPLGAIPGIMRAGRIAPNAACR
jgi:hypothetical protein